MLAADPGPRRVSVHADAAVVDAILPGTVPVAVLIPPVADMLRAAGGLSAHPAGRYQLSRLGEPAMEASTTVADHQIRDGDVLVLGPPPTPRDDTRYDDHAIAVSATVATTARPWGRPQRRVAGAVAAGCLTGVGGLTLVRTPFIHNAITAAVAATAGTVALLGAVVAQRTWRDSGAALALSLIATLFAAVAGFVAVPGPPGLPHVMLAAAAAAATAVLAMRAAGCGGVTLTAVACASAVITGTALLGAMTSVPLRAIWSVSTLVSLGLLGAAARVSIVLAGLSPRLDADDIGPGVAAGALRADRWLTRLLAAFCGTAAAGAVVTVLTGAPRLSCLAFGALTGALLLLRSRGSDVRRAAVFVAGGIAVIATTFGVSAAHAARHGPWVAAATALLAGAAMGLGFVAPTTSPLARRGVELLESSALIAMVPLTAEICGLYGAVRQMSLP